MTRVHPAARRRALAAGAADDPVHAREPRREAQRAGAGGRRDRRQPADRRGSVRARARAAQTRIEIIPEPGQRRERCASARPAERARRRSTEPYALYLGKLAPNKGTDHLSTSSAARISTGRWSSPATDPIAPAIERAAAASGRRRPISRLGRQGEAARWLAHASLLIFPSRGPESLSRVLIEASALGIPDRRDGHGRHARHRRARASRGCCRRSPEALAGDVPRLRQTRELRARLG